MRWGGDDPASARIAIPPPGDGGERLYRDGVRARIRIAPGPPFSARRRYRHHVRITGAWFDAAVGTAIDRLGRLAGHQLRR